MARNRLLRRVDWRFLLPDVAPERVVCLAPALVEGLRATAAVVDADATAPASYDLAVAQDPDRSLCERAWAALRPGGAFYAECPMPRPGRLDRLRRELAAVGFEDPAFYWFWPWGESVRLRVWLPVGSRSAIRYYFANRPPSPSPFARALNAVLRLAWRASLAGGMQALAVIARRPVDPDSAIADTADLGRFVRGSWSAWGFGTPPQRLRSLLLTGGPRSISKPVGLLFANDEPTPRIAVKFSRVPESSPAIRNEARVLAGLARNGRAVDGAPRVVFVHDRPNGVVVGETVIAGTPFGMALRWSNAPDLVAAGTRWLGDLGANVRSIETREWWERLVAAPSREFARLYGEVVSDRELAAAERLTATLGPLPLVCEHRDFSPWNVLLRHDHTLGVLDWESAEQDGLPLRDLTYFLAYVGFFLEGAMTSRRFVATYRHLLDPTTPLGSLSATQTSVYCDTLGIPRSAASPLRLLTWMVHSFSEYRSLGADVGGRPSADRLQAGLFLALWREELRAAAVH